MTVEQSAVLVLVPEAEGAVGELRAELDEAAGWGVPAHVTVIYPFLPPDRVGPAELARLRAAVASVPRFATAFTEVRWFGEDVVWLSPDPADGFRALTAAVWAAFPECPPYAGEHLDSVPHLTVAHVGGPARLRAAADVVAGRLPVAARVERAHLLQGREAPGAWHVVADLPLG